MAAFERGLWPVVAGCFNKQATYGQFYFLPAQLNVRLRRSSFERDC
jgi:hypothetical protein